jgi:hypothetical protein
VLSNGIAQRAPKGGPSPLQDRGASAV